MHAIWKNESTPINIKFSLFSECGVGSNWILWNMIIERSTGNIMSNNKISGPSGSNSDNSILTIEYSTSAN
jgi:hypothetical protein